MGKSDEKITQKGQSEEICVCGGKKLEILLTEKGKTDIIKGPILCFNGEKRKWTFKKFYPRAIILCLGKRQPGKISAQFATTVSNMQRLPYAFPLAT